MTQGKDQGQPARRVRPKRMPSMADVAAVAGVSHQTVSRVINNKGSVKEATRQRVMAAMSDLGYRRNESARALASSQSRQIGVITPRFVEWGPATILLSLQLAANRADYFVSVATLSEFTSEAMREALDDLLSLGVAGIIAIAPVVPMARELEAQTIPVPTLAVASAWIAGDSRLTRVGVDQRVGTRQALEHVKAEGCRSVAHIAGPSYDFDAMERDDAWREYTQELGLRLGPRAEGDWTAGSGYNAMIELLEEPLPDAIFVANDQMSLGALKALEEAGVEVPEDVLLFGFDDQDGGAYFSPSLTTVHQDFEKVGADSIEALTAMIAGQTPHVEAIPTRLVVRQSA